MPPKPLLEASKADGGSAESTPIQPAHNAIELGEQASKVELDRA